ncbi:MAG: hypothetical protein ACE5G7_05610, partial [Candidatus Hydrothermarchaeaceae archaeon]
MTGREALRGFINGIEVSVTAIIFAFVGYKIGENLGGLYLRMIGVLAGAFGGYCFAVRNILKTAPKK